MRRITLGLLGGLIGTMIMELFGVGIFRALGVPMSSSFSIIGNATAGFFSAFGIIVPGDAPLGIVTFCLIGLVFGAFIAITVWNTHDREVPSMKRGLGLSILWVEILSVPLLIVATIVLQLELSAAAQWFSISFVMHLVYGIVAGAVIGYGLRHPAQPGLRH